MDSGDIHWVNFPSGAGRAQAGRRPAVTLQSAKHARLPTAILVPLTSKQDALRFPGTVLIEPDGDNGLSIPSIALVFQITAVDRQFIGNRTGRISVETLQDILNAIDEFIGE